MYLCVCVFLKGNFCICVYVCFKRGVFYIYVCVCLKCFFFCVYLCVVEFRICAFFCNLGVGG